MLEMHFSVSHASERLRTWLAHFFSLSGLQGRNKMVPAPNHLNLVI